MEHQSVTVWLRQLANGDQEAAKKLWDRYGPELVELSRRRFGGALGALGDEEDLVQSVFRTLWTWATDGRLDGVQDREHLWWLLLKISRRKALNRHAYNKRQKRDHPTISLSGFSEDDSSPAPEDLIADDDQPPPDLILILAEEQERLLEMLNDDVLKLIAVWKMDGHTHEDIAQKLKVTTRTVIRKFNLIREIWSRELDS
ncbi:MAG: DNA-directed polymerase specialized sigma subunit, sigma24 [Planctomycetaceae bacterium]|nr:DNA-directed polymerase specialized sigma subunit, sigma24 [Planctomycetaceae bacterium]